MNKIVFTIGCFDCFHEGHKNLLSKMLDESTNVVVFVHSDESIYENKNRFPVQQLDLRMKNIQKTGLAHHVYPIMAADPSMEINSWLTQLKSQGYELVFMRGDDWLDFPGKKVIERLQIPIKFISYTKGISTSMIREELK